MKIRKGYVYNIGINNADYDVTRSEVVDGKPKIVWRCPYYKVWYSMIERCYSAVYLKKRPTYRGCSVCDDWIYFMTFKAWMMSQDWEGKQLDKDILVEGNKVYSPENCRFIEGRVNNFIIDCAAARGEWPLGVHFHKECGKFLAQCQNSFTKKRQYLGLFTCPEAAHEAWRKRKHEIACALADLQDDPDIAQALRGRFKPK